MFDKQFFANIAEKITNNLPQDLGGLKDDFLSSTKMLLQESFAKLDLVTREEFEVQKKVLARLQERVAELEKRV